MKKNFPRFVNIDLEFSLSRQAEATIKEFTKNIYPILHTFGLLDDRHITKYLACDTTEVIYKDALAENPQSVYVLQQEALIEAIKEKPEDRKDVWSILRAGSLDKETNPEDAGFVFKPIPSAGNINRVALLKAISVNNLKLSYDREYLRRVSVIQPTKEQIELYHLVCDFCADFNKMKLFKKYPINILFWSDVNGIHANMHTITRKTFIEKF